MDVVLGIVRAPRVEVPRGGTVTRASDVVVVVVVEEVVDAIVVSLVGT